MHRFLAWTIKHRRLTLAAFVMSAVVCLLLSTQVQANFNMVDYLPDKAPSTIAMHTMNEVFETPVPNLRVMVPHVSIPEALDYKRQFEATKGVTDVTWLDNRFDLNQPVEMLDPASVDDFYREDAALFSLAIDEDIQAETIEQIREIIGEEGAISGNPMNTVNAQQSSKVEIGRITLFLIPIILLILLFTTTSWLEPLLFLINLGVAIALNLGTNIILGEVSSITRSTGIILQLACSMDYAIFLVDRFTEMRAEGHAPLEAMTRAVRKSIPSILSSGLTTVVGFAALIAMQFKIGPDMGIVLAKGIVLSLVTTIVFMPSLTMCCYKWIDKTKHRSFLPSFGRLGKGISKIKLPVAVLVLLLLVPCFLAQNSNTFVYGPSGMVSPNSKVAHDRDAILEKFGESATFAIMVPRASLANEQALNDELKAMPEVSGVLSYVENVGRVVPESFVPKGELGKLNAAEYTRLVVMARVPAEGERTFAFVEKLRSAAHAYYGDDYYLAGESANVYDMKATITKDSSVVLLISVGAIALILLLLLRSLTLPFMLLLTIEASIFINLAIPYFMGQQLNYIGFLIISSIMLGATVDYAILFTDRYKENRMHLPKAKAITNTITDSAGSIFTSGGILAISGLTLGLISSNVVISQLGILIARGAVMSVVLVLVFLPAQLAVFDSLVRKTTLQSNFYVQKQEEPHENS